MDSLNQEAVYQLAETLLRTKQRKYNELKPAEAPYQFFNEQVIQIAKEARSYYDLEFPLKEYPFLQVIHTLLEYWGTPEE